MMIKKLIGHTLTCGVLALGVMLGRGQSLTFTTTAGYAGQGSADGAGSNARFNVPCGLATDSAGNLYVADTANHTVRMITPAGVVSTLAGRAGVSGSDDGFAAYATFNQPQGIAVDANGVVYVADTGNHTIRVIRSGLVITLAGTAGVSGYSDGFGTAAQFNYPQGLAVDSYGNLYVADTWNHVLRQVTSGGVVTTVAGTVGMAGSADGLNGDARFNQPQAIAIDWADNLYVTDFFNHTVRLVTTDGVDWTVTTLAGLPAVWGGVDGTNTNARFYNPQGVAVDDAGNVYVAEAGNHTIRAIAPDGTVSTLAGVFGTEGSTDGVGSGARFRSPRALAVSGNTLYVADSGNGTIRQVAALDTGVGVVSTLAGAPSIGAADGAGGNARFYGPAGAAADSAGNIYVADAQNSTIRKVTPTGEVTTLAGVAGVSGVADGPADMARFNNPQAVAVDKTGYVYVADTGNHAIRKISPGGLVTTLAGQPGLSGTADGPGLSARFYGPQGVAVATNGTVYVADTWNHTIRVISPAGVVSTLAGAAGSYGTTDGLGTSALFYEPQGLAVDGNGKVYVADSGNHTIRTVTAGGVVTTLAGSAGQYGSLDAKGTNALFYGPSAVMVDSTGTLYVSDYYNQTLRKVAADGTVSTVAGGMGQNGSVDGAALSARFSYPGAMAASSGSAFYVADTGNNALRLGMFSLNGGPAILAQPQSQFIDQQTPVSFSVTATGAPLSYQWRFNGAPIGGATRSSYSLASVQPGNAGAYSVVVSNAHGSVTSIDAMLTLNGAPVVIVPPQNAIVLSGQGVVFSTLALGVQPLGYQWLFNGQSLDGETGPCLSLASVAKADAGAYSVVVSNQFGFTTSSSANLVVAVLPRTWGDYSWGQTNAPVPAGHAIALAAGAWHTLALAPEGYVVGWGDDFYGQCDAPATLDDALAIAAGTYHSLAVRADGTVVAWGSDDSGQTEVPDGLTQVIGIAGGRGHSLALKADGTVVAWGDNTYGQCNVPAGLSQVVSVAAGGNHSLALKADGTVVGWGENTDSQGSYSGQSVPPAGLANVVGIAAGDYHSLAVQSNGKVTAWGDNSQTQCNVPSSLTSVVGVCAGGMHSLALRSSGSVVAWGANWNGQCQIPSGVTNIVGIAAGEAHSVALPAATEPFAWLWNPTWQGGRFNAVVQTLYRRNYALDYSASLAVSNWTALLTNSGNGTLKQLGDTNAVAPQGFYRLREW